MKDLLNFLDQKSTLIITVKGFYYVEMGKVFWNNPTQEMKNF
jgi:hypothetical protein